VIDSLPHEIRVNHYIMWCHESRLGCGSVQPENTEQVLSLLPGPTTTYDCHVTEQHNDHITRQTYLSAGLTDYFSCPKIALALGSIYLESLLIM
jgi:hypothetical protein